MTNTMLDDSTPIFRPFIPNASQEELLLKLDAVGAAMGEEAFTGRIAREIVARTQPQQAVPEIYAHFRSVVADGIQFFLSRVNRRRLAELVVSQLQLDPAAGSQERLLELAKRFPTLHKMGQIIARNPAIDPALKKWLVQLENGRYGPPLKGIIERIDGQLELMGTRDQVKVKSFILSEASVGAVVPFAWRRPSQPNRLQGVFKVLKPGIRRCLEEELAILEKTALFFEENRAAYPLKDFGFLSVFKEVHDMLVNEVNLAGEQAYLVEAARFYEDMPSIQVPALFPFNTDAMTAMAYLNGPKITDAPLNPEQRRHCAAVLFEALICRPLFSPRERSLFHGDPHAGNILAVNGPAPTGLRIGLLDWSLAGRLTKRDRAKTAQLIQAVLKKDLSGIRRAVTALACSGNMDRPMQRRNFRALVLDMIRSPGYGRLTLIKRTFKLLERLSLEGFVFSADLMLFSKAAFTLEGVLYDLWPAFDMDAAFTRHLRDLMTREIPRRFANLLLPLADRPENYASLISNFQLHSLMVHHCTLATKPTRLSRRGHLGG